MAAAKDAAALVVDVHQAPVGTGDENAVAGLFDQGAEAVFTFNVGLERALLVLDFLLQRRCPLRHQPP